MDPQTQELLRSVFGGALWNSYQRIDQMDSRVLMGTLSGNSRLALLLGFMLFALQLGRTAYLSYRDGRHPFTHLTPVIFRALLVGLLLIPGVYHTFVRFVFAWPADTLSNYVTGLYIDHFRESIDQMSRAIADSGGNPLSLILTDTDGLIATLLGALVFWAAAICVYVMPILQSVLFLYLFYLGPICLVFSLFDLTAGVSRSWVAMTLTVAWLGFFGSTAFLVADSLDFVNRITASASVGNLITVGVYGVIAIVLFIMAWPITAFFFSATGSLGAVMSPAAAIGTATAGGVTGLATGAAASMVAGGMVAGTGRLLQHATGGAGRLADLSNVLQEIGRFGINRGASTLELASPRNSKSIDAVGSFLAQVGGVPFRDANAKNRGINAASAGKSFASAKSRTADALDSGIHEKGAAKQGVDVDAALEVLGAALAQKPPSDLNAAFPLQSHESISRELKPVLPEGKSDEGVRSAPAIPNEVFRPGLAAETAGVKPGFGATTKKYRIGGKEAKSETDLVSSFAALEKGLPRSVDAFREAFPFTPRGVVENILKPFVDKRKVNKIPQGLQVVPFRDETLLEAKKRIGNALNRRQDVMRMQDQAFLSNLLPKGTPVPRDARIEKRKGESFADAAIRTATDIESSQQKA